MKLKHFIKTIFIFLTGNVLSKLISFFLLPLYTSEINPIQFGSYDVAVSFIHLIVPISFFQIWDGMYRFAFDYKDKSDKQKVISNSIIVMLFGGIIYLALFSLVQAFFNFEYFGFILAYGCLYAINYIYTYSARVFLSNKLFVFSGLAATVTTALLNIILIARFHWDIKSIYVSAIIGLLIQVVIIEMYIGVFKSFNIKKIDKYLIIKMLKFSIPLCIATVSYWLLSGLTKIFVQNIVGNYANGIYAVANKFGSLITLLVSVFQFAWNELAYMMTDDDLSQRKSSYSICINIMSVGVILGTSIICLGIKIIFPYVINAKYYEAIWIMPATIIGVAANSLAGFIGTLFMAEKKNGFIMISTFISAGANILAGYFFTTLYGLQGAIVTLSFCFVLLFVLRFSKISNIYQLNIKKIQLFLSVFILAVSTVAFFYVDSVPILILFCMIIFGILCFCFKDYIRLFTGRARGRND